MNNFKELVLVEKEFVCDTIMSFYFKAKDGHVLPSYQGGQFLPIKITNDDGEEIIRAYSLSNYPNEQIYRITVKKIENGKMSPYLHDKLNVGDTVLYMPPSGRFTIKEKDLNEPIVLLSGGIGVTPILCMLYCEQNKRKDITFVQAIQNSNMHPFKDDIHNICKLNGYKNFVFFSNPLESDVQGVDYDFNGYINKQWIQENINLKASFYFCGPPLFMQMLEKSLLELGVPKEKINYEYFGPKK